MRPDKVSIYVDSVVAVHDIVERFGSIPEAFEFCFVCQAPATYILCCKDEALAARMKEGHSEQSAEALSQCLRAQFQTDFELPVCDTHFETPQ